MGEEEGDRGRDTAAGGGGRAEVRGMGRRRAIEGEIRQLEEEEERR